MLTLVLTAVSLVLWEVLCALTVAVRTEQLVSFLCEQPASAGSGIPEVIGFLNGVSAERLMDLTTFVGKLLGVMCAVSSGLFVGPEGNNGCPPGECVYCKTRKFQW